MIPAPDPAAAAAAVIDDVVQAWHADHFHGLGLLLSAELSHRLAVAREDLAARLKARLLPTPVAPAPEA